MLESLLKRLRLHPDNKTKAAMQRDCEEAAKLLEAGCSGLGQCQPEGLEHVDGDALPPVGSKVLIELSSKSAWVEHTVTGYYAWNDLAGDPSLHRVFVRVKDAAGIENARLLKDVRVAG